MEPVARARQLEIISTVDNNRRVRQFSLSSLLKDEDKGRSHAVLVAICSLILLDREAPPNINFRSIRRPHARA